MTRFAQFAAALLFILQCVAVSAGDDRINIILGTAPPLLEEFAATEMAAQFKRLFNAEISCLRRKFRSIWTVWISSWSRSFATAHERRWGHSPAAMLPGSWRNIAARCASLPS